MTEIYLNDFNNKTYDTTFNYLVYNNTKYNELDVKFENNNEIKIYFSGTGEIFNSGGKFYPTYDGNTIEDVNINVLKHNNEMYILIEGNVDTNYYIKCKYFIFIFIVIHLNALQLVVVVKYQV